MSTTIDAHHHLWQIRRYDYGWITPETPVLGRDYMPVHLAPELRAAGVARTVLVQTFHSEAETRWFLQLADQHPFIAGVVGWSDLTDPDLGARLDALAHPKLVGLRHVVQGEPDVDWLVHPAVIQGLKELERRGLSFDLLLLPQHLKHVPTLARALPALRMVIDHLAKPPIREGQLEPWARDLAAAAEHPNVFCKLSGMVTEADHAQWTVDDLRPYVAHALEVFGPARCMYGSDWPVCNLAASYAQQHAALRELVAQWSEADQAGIFGETAAAFYRLSPQLPMKSRTADE